MPTYQPGSSYQAGRILSRFLLILAWCLRVSGSLKMSKDGLAWFMLGSHSLHRMAWGYLELVRP